MIANLGLIALGLAALAAIYSLVAAIVGGRQKRPDYIESARRAAVVVMPLLTLACLAIIASNLTGDYSLEYTYRVSNDTTPTFLRITALWGGQNGSILFWNWLMSLYIFFVFLRPWKSNRDLLPWVIAVSIGTQAFFILLTIFFANPFARLFIDTTGNISSAVFQPAGLSPFRYPDGQGLNPLLRHPGMIIHPPMLYLGFVGLVIPFAYAMAALIAKNKTNSWIIAMRRPILVAWLFLSMGLLLGARWAYDVLGWGGYWGWDPVENSALLPWLAATAFLHSVIIQEKRGMFKVWNMILIVLSFCLMIYGTFVTRTGVISSVHSFARSSLGIPFVTFVGIVFLGSAILIVLRWDILKSDNKLESFFSREAMFLLNNFVFMTLTFTVFVGTNYSMFSELLVGDKLTVGPPVYNQLIGPQVAALVLLMGIGPLAAWHKSSTEALGKMIWKPAVLAVVVMVLLFVTGVNLIFAVIGFGLVTFSLAITVTEYWRGMRARHKLSGENYFKAFTHLIERNRRRYGGYLIHLGVLVMGIGVIGSLNFQVQTQRSLAPGGQMQVGPYTITYERALTCDPSTGQMSADCAAWYTERGQDIEVIAGYMTIEKAGQAPMRVAPYREIFLNGTGELTPPGVVSTIGEDIYLLFLGEQSGFGTIKAYINPLIQFLWVGGIILVIGTLVAMWPTPLARRQTVTAPTRAVAVK
ncbi:MAG TPA: cytochrome c-type biogenesis CcmF C-terminal domain-containing protein [Anaerolineae bacterium]|nr:cytochrome c-type biogenesis CcmF C-terminal domain-containing protein [Anaerolineae bacterium]